MKDGSGTCLASQSRQPWQALGSAMLHALHHAAIPGNLHPCSTRDTCAAAQSTVPQGCSIASQVIAEWTQLLTAPIAYAAGVAASRVLLQTINDSSILACGTTEASSASCCCDSDVQVNFYITAASDAEAQGLSSAFTRASLGANNSFATCLQQVRVCSAPVLYCQDTWPESCSGFAGWHQLHLLVPCLVSSGANKLVWPLRHQMLTSELVACRRAASSSTAPQSSALQVRPFAATSLPDSARLCFQTFEQNAEACITFLSSL